MTDPCEVVFIRDTGIWCIVHEQPTGHLVGRTNAQVATLLAAKDAEIERLREAIRVVLTCCHICSDKAMPAEAALARKEGS